MARIVYIEPDELPKPKEAHKEPCASCGSPRTKIKLVRVPRARISNIIYCLDCASWDYSKSEVVHEGPQARANAPVEQ